MQFLLGFFLGAIVGIVLMAIVAAGRDGYDLPPHGDLIDRDALKRAQKEKPFAYIGDLLDDADVVIGRNDR